VQGASLSSGISISRDKTGQNSSVPGAKKTSRTLLPLTEPLKVILWTASSNSFRPSLAKPLSGTDICPKYTPCLSVVRLVTLNSNQVC